MENNNINYVRQKTFSGCKYNGLLKFDVYDSDNNIAIEFQGEQHYFPVDFEKNNPEKAEKDFEKLKIRDNIKKEYCLKNNITLVCVPYWERRTVDSYLMDNVKVYKEKYLA